MRFGPAITAAILATGLATAPAMAASNGYVDNTAQGNAGASSGTWMSIGAIADQFTQNGYTVRGVEVDDGRYEVEAIDPNGMMIEAYVDPVTGNILRQERDD